MRVLSFVLLFAAFSAHAEPYCLALRGNGELIPAHWGALARTVETYGVPTKMSGGSSASISLFLLESAALNPSVQSENAREQAVRAAYLMKSMQGFSEHFMASRKWKPVLSLLKSLSSAKSGDDVFPKLAEWLKDRDGDINTNRITRLKDAIAQVKESGVFYGPSVKNALKAINDWESAPSAARTQHLATQI
ncbi:MAG: hypothetical protein EOP09_08020, partial [Proteobacteria bacterium]